MTDSRIFQRTFLLLLVLGISLLFLLMIAGFIMPVFLAAIFSGLAHGFYRRMVAWTGGRRNTGAVLTLLLMVLLILIPLGLFAGIVTEQAIEITNTARPFIEEQIRQTSTFEQLAERIPILQQPDPYRDVIVSRLGDFAGRLGGFLVGNLAARRMGHRGAGPWCSALA